ncbi:MAG: putative sulfate exporter family transporter, partial [Muribaculaceae bacterium]|nr:putative sulfate exporter family transporter [Muribaculaceae bacterium]
GAAYGAEACDLATLIKCTRALWIIPLAFFTMWFFRKNKGGEGHSKVNIPWFILFFVVAMIINTYTPESAMSVMGPIYQACVFIAKKALVAVLFTIGASLSIGVIRQVGIKPLMQAMILWVIIGASSLAVVLFTV